MMNVDLLAQFIETALRQKGVVMVPYVGTFAIATEPARIASNGYVILPPSVKVDFQETFSGGTDISLAELLSQEKDLQLNTAIARVDSFCKEFKKVLIENKCVILPGLGKVRATKENDLFFVPENDLEIGGEFFCLEAIHLKVSEPEAAVVKIPEIVEVEPQEVAQAEKAESIHAEQAKEAEEAEKAQEVQVAQAVKEEPTQTPATPKISAFGKALIIVAVLAILAIAAFIILSRMYPGSTDFLLYNQEEIKLIEYFKL